MSDERTKTITERAIADTREALALMEAAVAGFLGSADLWEAKRLWDQANERLQRAALFWAASQPGCIINEIEPDGEGRAVAIWPFGKPQERKP